MVNSIVYNFPYVTHFLNISCSFFIQECSKYQKRKEIDIGYFKVVLNRQKALLIQIVSHILCYTIAKTELMTPISSKARKITKD